MEVQHIVDCDAEPSLRPGWEVRHHNMIGQLNLSTSRIKPHLSLNQIDGRRIEGFDLYSELVSEPILNSNVMDYFLVHQDCIPDEFKKSERIFFWGTIIYNIHSELLCVRYMYFNNCRWLDGGYAWLGESWHSNSPAAVLEREVQN